MDIWLTPSPSIFNVVYGCTHLILHSLRKSYLARCNQIILDRFRKGKKTFHFFSYPILLISLLLLQDVSTIHQNNLNRFRKGKSTRRWWVLFTSNFKVTASKKKRSADAQSSRFTNLTHNHTYSYSRGGKITTKHVTFKNAIMTPLC